MNVSLSPKFEAYIRSQLEAGTYSNASEVIREALRLKMQQDEIYQTKLDAMRSAIIHGEESGQSVPFDIHSILSEAHKDAGLDV